ncbi:MAG: hypothetical protein UHN47_12955 [Lachnospiraceae bacterium]|nr:hypothetical protein [Lachnospiraceae bacterium]
MPKLIPLIMLMGQGTMYQRMKMMLPRIWTAVPVYQVYLTI